MWTNRLQSTWRWSSEPTICFEHYAAVAHKSLYKPLLFAKDKREKVDNEWAQTHIYPPAWLEIPEPLLPAPLSSFSSIAHPNVSLNLFLASIFLNQNPHLSLRLFSCSPFFSAPFLFVLLSDMCLCPSSCLPATLHLHPSILSSEWVSFLCRLIVKEEKWEHETVRGTKQAFDSNGIMR